MLYNQYGIMKSRCFLHSVCIVMLAVFGFDETSFTAEERGESYSVEVGYIKGASAGSPVRNVTIEAEGITAGQQHGQFC